MYLTVRFSGFDRNDHKLFHHQNGIATDKELSKAWRANRTMIQAYLYRIQARINRGQMKGAVHLFNSLVVKIDAPKWVQSALKEELTNPNAKTK
jgi:hypothetical protein